MYVHEILNPPAFPKPPEIRIGTRVKKDSDVHMIVKIWPKQADYHAASFNTQGKCYLSLVSLSTGLSWTTCVEVIPHDCHITWDIFKRIAGTDAEKWEVVA
jgi:hypothetical protein